MFNPEVKKSVQRYPIDPLEGEAQYRKYMMNCVTLAIQRQMKDY
jgi:hypothetical protein